VIQVLQKWSAQGYIAGYDRILFKLAMASINTGVLSTNTVFMALV
jgi:hypothetical protein